jgi:N-acetylmuramoyl-L-alanine amidase-like protein
MGMEDLTRRGLIRRATAVSGALLGIRAALPGLVFAGDDGEAVFQMRLPRGRMHAGAWSSGPVEAPRGFELLGVEAGDSGAEVRVLGADGRWSDWLEAPAADGHGPDAARAGASVLTDPVWTGPARVFEVRAARPLRGARVVLVDSGSPATAAAAKRFVDAGLPAGAGQPAIIARSSWATAACRPRVPAVFGAVELAFVHHTVSSNAYRPSQSAGMVRAICLFHKYGNGWNDIGYNFVVDRYGQVFEARAGGIDETIVGAQAGGYNVYSTGVALLGTFTFAGPGRKTFDALAHLLAWKLSIHGVELPGHTTVSVTPQGAPYSRYRAGARVRLNRVAGHRDADATSCPGNGAYRQLPRLRQSVQRLAGTLSSLTLDLTQTTAGSVTVGGLLTAAGSPVGGAPIEVQQRSTTRGPHTIAVATTNLDGSWSISAPLATNALVRAVYRGDPFHAAIVSPGVGAQVPAQVTLSATAQQVAPGGVIDFTGSTAPAKRKVSIVLSQQQPDGTFTTVRTIRLGADSSGTFTRSIGFPDAGQFLVVAHTAPDNSNAIGTSPPVAITVA